MQLATCGWCVRSPNAPRISAVGLTYGRFRGINTNRITGCHAGPNSLVHPSTIWVARIGLLGLEWDWISWSFRFHHALPEIVAWIWPSCRDSWYPGHSVFPDRRSWILSSTECFVSIPAGRSSLSRSARACRAVSKSEQGTRMSSAHLRSGISGCKPAPGLVEDMIQINRQKPRTERLPLRDSPLAAVIHQLLDQSDQNHRS